MDDKEKLEQEREQLEREKEELETAKKRLAREKEKLEQEKEEMEERQSEQEEVIERLGKTEFNNFEEDKKIIQNEKQKAIFEKNKPLIIVGIVLLIVILLGAIFLFKESVKKKPTESSSTNSQEFRPADDNLSYYANNNSILLFQKYLYHEGSKTITDLLGHKITQLDNNYEIKLGDDFIYEVSALGGKERSIKRFNGEKFYKIIEKKYDTEEEKSDTGILVNTQNTFVGMYDNSKNSSILYLLDQESYRMISLPNLEAYTFNIGAEEPIIIYDKQYVMTRKNNLIGLYDVKNEKELLKPVYQDLISISDNKFIAVQNGKAGIIDASGKILLDFRYSMLEKAGGYYVAGKENGIVILNDQYQEIENSTLSVPNLSRYTYHVCCGNANPLVVKNINNHLIIGIGANGYETVIYYYFDQNHQFIKLVSGTIKTVGSYLLIQEKGSTNISVYDKNMTRVQGFDLQDSLENRDMSLFLGDYLVATKNDAEPKFFVISTGETKKVINSFIRDHKQYRVTFTFTNRSKNLGTIIIQQEDQELARLENASFINYISAFNNGVHFIENRLVYSAGGDILVLK